VINAAFQCPDLQGLPCGSGVEKPDAGHRSQAGWVSGVPARRACVWPASWRPCRDDPDTLGCDEEDQAGASAQQGAAEEMVRRVREQGLALTGPAGLLRQLTKTVLETALDQELTEHLGHERHGKADPNNGNVRNGTRSKTVLTENSGQVQILPGIRWGNPGIHHQPGRRKLGSGSRSPRPRCSQYSGTADINSVSCWAPGQCSAGGSYTAAGVWPAGATHGVPPHQEAFLLSETNGIWGTAEPVPGAARLNAGGEAGISSVSCTSTGACSAGGGYASGDRALHALVVAER
jgi:hypothetical protein